MGNFEKLATLATYYVNLSY